MDTGMVMDMDTEKRIKRKKTEKNGSENRGHHNAVRFLLVFLDLIFTFFSFFLALWFRFDCRFDSIPKDYFDRFLEFIPFLLVITVGVFWCFRLYHSIWRFASYVELTRVTGAVLICIILHYSLMKLCFGPMPRSYYIFGFLMHYVAALGIRFSYRFLLLISRRRNLVKQATERVMIIGAGQAGRVIIREMNRQPDAAELPVCIIDDDPAKRKTYIDGIPVVGGKDDILSAVEEYKVEKIYFAIPSADAEERRDFLTICKETGCELKSLPRVIDVANRDFGVKNLKEVSIEDLLGREQVEVSMEEIYKSLAGKTILVTGGGGSIGSELCRQIAMHGPRQLVIFDVYENNAYEIQNELKRHYPNLNLAVLIGSVRDTKRVNQIFRDYRPDIVYHAAAHKHVPLMETSPYEAVKNNVFGTYKVAYAAMMYGVRRFVLISTDKAVNPTNVMGATKRICEMIIQSFDRKIKANKECEIPVITVHRDDEDGAMFPLSEEGEVRRDKDGNEIFTLPGQDGLGHRKAQTEFVAVRFGNVLGSNGSVVPLFKKQIAEGGPVTVTHPDIVRYFMTIPEAVRLVLQAGTYAKGGEIFVLDMGEPVKIDDLARNLIKLSGFRPDVDIKVEYSGLRPGEKLYEEKLMAEEGLAKTANKLIYVGHPIDFDEDVILKKLQDMMKVAYENTDAIRLMIQDMVDTFHPTSPLRQDEEAAYRAEIREILGGVLRKTKNPNKKGFSRISSYVYWQLCVLISGSAIE